MQFWEPKYILPGRGNSVYFSSNGFSLQLQNIEEVRGENGIETKGPKAKYELVAPKWATLKEDLSYEEGMKL